MKFMLIDVETTGLLKPSCVALSKQPKIIELGAMIVDGDGLMLDEFNELINPGEVLPKIITKITGITDEDLADRPGFAQILPRFIMFAKKHGPIDFLIAHNAPFDSGMLKNELTRAGCEDFPWPAETICTVQEYKHRNGGRWPKLTVLYEKIMGKSLAQTHRAIDDVKVLHEILVEDCFYAKLAG